MPLTDYRVMNDFEQRPSSDGCELIFAFSCSQHTFMSLESQIALFEKVPAHTLELNVQRFGFLMSNTLVTVDTPLLECGAGPG